MDDRFGRLLVLPLVVFLSLLRDFFVLCCLDFIMRESEHILTSILSIHLNVSVGPDEMGFGGHLDMYISVHLVLSLLSLLMLLSFLGSMKW